MVTAPIITSDGQLTNVGDIHFDAQQGVARLNATMQFCSADDKLRGLMRDIAARMKAEKCPLETYCQISGRSGHSRIGLDVTFTDEEPQISDKDKTISLGVTVSALNPDLGAALSDLQNLVETHSIDIGRLFIPLTPALSKKEIEAAVQAEQILLPPTTNITDDGCIELLLEDYHFIMSKKLLNIPKNFTEMIVRGKHGLSTFQHPSPSGLPSEMKGHQFLVSAVHIALGPYCAFIQRELNNPNIWHLASRLLDGIRTTGLQVPRHVELFNISEKTATTKNLRVRLKIYHGSEQEQQIANRLFTTPEQTKTILQRGIDITELTSLFDPTVCENLFDEISPSPELGGAYGRLIMPGKLITIPWEQEDNHWMPAFQWRLLYETARGTISAFVLSDNKIPKRFQPITGDLSYVGGEQRLSKIFLADSLPPIDTLRMLKQNDFGVVLLKSISSRVSKKDAAVNVYLDQNIYEELVNLTEGGMRFFLFIEEGEYPAHVREFYKGFWVTDKGKEELDRIHTTIAVFGSAIDQTKDSLLQEFNDFLQKLNNAPELRGHFAVTHGSGPGVMKAIDDAAAEIGIARIGVGIDAEKIGQKINMAPEILVHFISLALNTRQDIMDRRSIFKIFNVGGFGTSYEINMALTFMKIGHCLPAPYIFVDPFGLGPNGKPLWQQTIDQFKTITTPQKIKGEQIPPLGPNWVINCCHLVRSYSEGLDLILNFINDPCSYWEKAGVKIENVLRARNNLKNAKVAIPPYIEQALNKK